MVAVIASGNNKNDVLYGFTSFAAILGAGVISYFSFGSTEEVTDSYADAVQHAESESLNTYRVEVNEEAFRQHIQETLQVETVEFPGDIQDLFNDEKGFTTHIAVTDAEGEHKDLQLFRNTQTNALTFEEVDENLTKNVIVE